MVDVPERLQEFAMEYRDGFHNGLKMNRRWCPLRGTILIEERRAAWKAGYQAGRRVAIHDKLRNAGQSHTLPPRKRRR